MKLAAAATVLTVLLGGCATAPAPAVQEVYGPWVIEQARSAPIIDKRRERAGESEVMNIIGEVKGKSCILIDDIVDSGGTLCNAAEALLDQGAKDVSAYITHGVLSGGAVARITSSKLKNLVITDSIQPTEAVKVARNIRVISIASLIGEAMRASDLATISPAQVFAREIASGEFCAVRIVRPSIEQTTWMSFGAHRALSAAAEVVTRLIRKLTVQQRKAHAKR